MMSEYDHFHLFIQYELCVCNKDIFHLRPRHLRHPSQLLKNKQFKNREETQRKGIVISHSIMNDVKILALVNS